MKFSQVATNAAPALGDYLMGVTTTNVDFRVTLTNLIAVLLKSNYLSNPSKFSVYRQATLSSAGAPIVMDQKTFDDRNEYSTSTGLFTAQESGTYYFQTQTTQATGNFAYMWGTIFKNGVEYRRGNRTSYVPASGCGVWCMVVMKLVAGDTISFGFATSTTIVIEVGDTLKTMGEGFMISKT